MSEEAYNKLQAARLAIFTGHQTIELDCAPGTPRPDSYIKGVIKDLALPEREPVAKFFGMWTWDYNDIDVELWNAIKPILAARITRLYNQGRIRYGSW